MIHISLKCVFSFAKGFECVLTRYRTEIASYRIEMHMFAEILFLQIQKKVVLHGFRPLGSRNLGNQEIWNFLRC